MQPENIRCKNLSGDNLCKCYSRRFAAEAPDRVIIGFVDSVEGDVKPFICARIRLLIADKELPKEVENQCCIAHPELLKTCTLSENQ